MDPTSNIDQFKQEIRKWGEVLMRKHNCKLFRNDRTNLGYIEGPEPVCSWTDYVTRVDLPEVPDDKFDNIVQFNMEKRLQGVGG